MNYTIYITNRDSVPLFADKHLTDIVSFGFGNDFPALGDITKYPFNLYRFSFLDISHEAEYGPTKQDIARLIQIYSFILSGRTDRRILFHCQAGVSRSTAAAFIFLVMAGQNYQDAYRLVNEARGFKTKPNQLMVKYADELLDKNGTMKNFIDIAAHS